MDHRMAVATIAFAIAGAVLTSLSAIALGSVKAAAKWPSAPKPKIARPIALIGAILGLILWVGGVGLTVWFAVSPDISTVMRSVYSGIGVAIAGAVGIYSCVKVSGKVELRELIELPDRPSSPPPVPVSATRYAQPDDINGSVDPSPQDAAPALPPGVPEYGPQSPPPSEPQQRPGPFLPDGSQVEVSPPPPSPVYNHPQVHQQPGATTWQEAAPTFMPHRSEDVPDQTHAPEPQSPAGPPMPEPTVAEVMHDAEPGWVYTDEHDNYFAAVSQSNGGVGLLSLTDFTVTPAENHPGPLTLVGSVEATVWPMDAEEEPASTPADSDQPDVPGDEQAEQLSGGSAPAPSPAATAANDDVPGEPERFITPPLNIGKNRQGHQASETTEATEEKPPVDSPSTDFEIIEPRSPQPSPVAPEPTQPNDSNPEPHEPMPLQASGSEDPGERQESTDAINPGFTDYRSKRSDRLHNIHAILTRGTISY